LKISAVTAKIGSQDLYAKIDFKVAQKSELKKQQEAKQQEDLK
jgi:hypothetical protein